MPRCEARISPHVWHEQKLPLKFLELKWLLNSIFKRLVNFIDVYILHRYGAACTVTGPPFLAADAQKGLASLRTYSSSE